MESLAFGRKSDSSHGMETANLAFPTATFFDTTGMAVKVPGTATIADLESTRGGAVGESSFPRGGGGE